MVFTLTFLTLLKFYFSGALTVYIIIKIMTWRDRDYEDTLYRAAFTLCSWAGLITFLFVVLAGYLTNKLKKDSKYNPLWWLM